jgi:transcriptional regulator with XRE-family HTH domain
LSVTTWCSAILASDADREVGRGEFVDHDERGTGGDDCHSFGLLLRQYRTVVGLTQEELAERAGLSARAISTLERGARRWPYRSTVQRLAQALGLAEADRAALEAAGLGRRQALVSSAPPPPPPTLPIPLSTFVGRNQELARIRQLLTTSRLVTLTGPGGIGKTRLAVEVARSLSPRQHELVAFASLAPVRDPALVPQMVATSVGVRELPGCSLT